MLPDLALIENLAREYPERNIPDVFADVPRTAAHLELVMARHDPPAAVCDLGGGTGLFAVAAAAHNYRATTVDDFGDSGQHEDPGDLPATNPHRSHGVTILSRDMIADGLDFAPESIDCFTAFETMEHWHNSPKKLFADVMRSLKPAGTLIIGVPNAVNLRKRLTVPFGRGKWSSMHDWYECETFRGHVREPDVDDLRYIARDLGLADAQIVGFNWQGYKSPRGWVRRVVPLVDRPLRRFPALCADIYLVGSKATASYGRQ